MKLGHQQDMSARSDVMAPTAEDVQVVEWRRRRLLDAGFPPDLALDLALNRDADLHALLDLVDRKCPPAVAVRIVG
jgi:hypothetical protein